MNLPLIFGLLLATGVGLILSSVLNTRSISFSDRVASQLRGETLRESLLKEQERRERQGVAVDDPGHLTGVGAGVDRDVGQGRVEGGHGGHDHADGRA